MQVPSRLVEEIAEGRCVAFVGAGFVMPTVPGWVDLLADLATLTDPETNALVSDLLSGQSSRHLEIAAQALKDYTKMDRSQQKAEMDKLAAALRTSRTTPHKGSTRSRKRKA